jgi:hypothetical protein
LDQFIIKCDIDIILKESCGLDGQWDECPLATDGFDGKQLQQLYRNVSLNGWVRGTFDEFEGK